MVVMVSGLSGMDGNGAVRQVNETLRGPFLEILSRYVPELKRLPPDRAYERTLDDIGLLQRCFAAFRAERQAFDMVLVDAERRPVSDDGALLACGRTLNEVVAMIVRTAAKRHFRRTLTPSGQRSISAARVRGRAPSKGFVHRMAALFRPSTQEHSQHRSEPARSAADELYDAIKTRLLHEWQVPLVPTYARMTPALVRALGDKLLEIRDQAQLGKIAADPAEAARLFELPEEDLRAGASRREERARLADIISPDGKRLRSEAFAAILLRPDVRAQLGGAAQGLHLNSILREVGSMPAKLLVAELGLRSDQLAVILLVAQSVLGNEMFGRVFGVPGDGAVVMRLTQKARLSGISQQSSLTECGTFIRTMFASAQQAGLDD